MQQESVPLQRRHVDLSAIAAEVVASLESGAVSGWLGSTISALAERLPAGATVLSLRSSGASRPCLPAS